MSINIEMPKLSDTMTEGTVVKWLKQVGDSIEIGDVLAEIETDKATMEMEAFDDGVLTEIKVEAGEKAPIGGILAVLNGDSGRAPDEAHINVHPDEDGDDKKSGEESAPKDKDDTDEEEADDEDQGGFKDEKKAMKASGSVPADSGDRVRASPLARKVAAELGVDLAKVSGSGPGGRIVRADVEKSAEKPAEKSSSSEAKAAAALAASAKGKSSSQPAAAPAVQAIQPVAKEGDETIELSTMRKVIASRLLTSKVTIPHFYLHLDVDAAPLMTLRKQVNEQAEKTHGNKYSVNDFVLKAVINATQAVPAINASFAGEHIVRYRHVGLSVAVAVEDGLVTPVIKQAEDKSLLAISRAVKDFATRAKDRKLRPDEFDGGTITVSNLGAWGIESFDAIINPPQAAILSVGAAIEKPVVKNGQIVPGLRMNLGLSCDHRVVDGAVAAQFLAEVKKLIEQPALMLL